MAVLFAFGFTLAAMVSAVAVDAASLYFERRQLQAGVDLAAISAAADPSRAVEIAQSVLVEAGLLAPASTDGLVVETGRYNPSNPDVTKRFSVGATPANAVSVSLKRSGTLHFAGHFAPTPTLGARGVAAVEPEVTFSIGSRLASFNAGLTNALLSQLLGTTVSLSVMDYNALLAAHVDAFAFLDALAFELGITAGTYDDVLALEPRAGVLAKALARLTTGAARTALTNIGLAGQGSPVPMGKLLTLGRLGALELGSSSAAPDALLSTFELLSAAAAMADGKQQLSAGVGASVPGLVSLSVDLGVGEPAQGGRWFAIGGAGQELRTAQTRLRLRSRLLGGAILLGAGVHLPIWLDLAHAEARVAGATCPSQSLPNGSARIEVRPGVLRLVVGELSDAGVYDFGALPPAGGVRVLDVLLLKIDVSAATEMASTQAVPLTFSSADIGAGTARTARSGTPITSLTGSLFDTLNIHVSVLGIGLAPPAIIAQALRTLFAPLAPVLDTVVVSLLSTLGLGIGEADVRVYGVRCTRAVLVE